MNRIRSQRRAGFTLIELLIVIGIILILIGVLLPMVLKSLKAAKRTRIASDLNAISTALEAYKQTYGDYPRILYFANTATPALNGTGSGADLLGKALLGLGPASVTSPGFPYSATAIYPAGSVVINGTIEYGAKVAVPAGAVPAVPSQYWQVLTTSSVDGADGPGARARAGGYGKVNGPFLQPDKFKILGLSILDYIGNPVLYYSGNPAKPMVTVKDTTVANYGINGNDYISTPAGVTAGLAPAATVPAHSYSLYNYSDNDTAALNTASASFQLPTNFPDSTNTGKGIMVMEAMMGNYSITGFVDVTKGEVAVTLPYLLWSAGPDGVYGPAEAAKDITGFTATTTPDSQRKLAVNRCDDVANFTFGQ